MHRIAVIHIDHEIKKATCLFPHTLTCFLVFKTIPDLPGTKLAQSMQGCRILFTRIRTEFGHFTLNSAIETADRRCRQEEAGQSRRRRTAAVMRQVAYAEVRDAIAPVMPDYGSAQAGKTAEDLFFYPVENVSLKKDQTGYYPLFTESVSYEHVYRWEIPADGGKSKLSSENFDSMVHPGRALKVKFRQPFVAKAKYFEAGASVMKVNKEIADDDITEATIHIEWIDIEAKDKEILDQFVDELDDFRKEVK